MRETAADVILRQVVEFVWSGDWRDADRSSESMLYIKDELLVSSECNGFCLRGIKVVGTCRRRSDNSSRKSPWNRIFEETGKNKSVLFGNGQESWRHCESMHPALSQTIQPTTMKPLKMCPLTPGVFSELSCDFAGSRLGNKKLPVCHHWLLQPISFPRGYQLHVSYNSFDRLFAFVGMIPAVITMSRPGLGKLFGVHVIQAPSSRHRVTPLWPCANGEAERFIAIPKLINLYSALLHKYPIFFPAALHVQNVETITNDKV